MKRKSFFILLVILLAMIGWPSLSAQAHAIDSANIDQYTRLEVGVKSIRIHYIMNMGNFPAYLERRAIDANVDAQVSSEEQEAYFSRKIPELLAGMPLTVDNNPVALRLVSKDLSFPMIAVPEVDGGLMTMLLVLDLDAQLPETTQSASFEYHNNNFADATGWREIVVRPLDGLTLNDSALEKEWTNELQAYPPEMQSTPLDMRLVTFTAAPGGAAQASATQISATPQPGLPRPAQYPTGTMSDDRFAGLIAAPTLTPQVILFSLLLSLLLGAGHALTPGHGKAIVGAYLVGNRGKAKDAIILGLTTTLTHTIGVFALGFVTMFVSSYILPERLFPWLELLSGALVVVIGLTMFWQRLTALLRYGYVPQNSHDDHGHDHDHDHEHHDHEHDHDHHDSNPENAGAGNPRASHEHGSHTHSHIPADDQPISLRGLLALGISGGLLPCPSALVVMLGAIALNRVAFGMLLIFVFSIGLAGVLTGIGLLLVYARQWFERFPTDGRWIRAISVVSAAVVTVAGLVISVGALAQMGLFRP